MLLGRWDGLAAGALLTVFSGDTREETISFEGFWDTKILKKYGNLSIVGARNYMGDRPSCNFGFPVVYWRDRAGRGVAGRGDLDTTTGHKGGYKVTLGW